MSLKIIVVSAFALFFLSGSLVSEASTFGCREANGGDVDGHYDEEEARELGIPLDRPYCKVLLMSGRIVPEDVGAFKEWLVREPYTHVIKIGSPGGSIEAAVEIGRVIRSRFMTVWTYDLAPEKERVCSTKDAVETLRILELPINSTSIKERQEICRKNVDCRIGNRCCVSACSLILAAGASRDARNVGLHRPSLKDFSQKSYDDTRKVLLRGQLLIETYLKEMEVPRTVFEKMMEVPPDELLLLDWVSASALFAGLPADKELIERRYQRPDFGLAPSIYDWLKPKCADSKGLDLWGCLRNELRRESVKRAKRLTP